VHSVSAVKTVKLEGDSSGVDLNNYCSNLERLGWVNVWRSWDDLLRRVLWWT
jgi:hypothetical protein